MLIKIFFEQIVKKYVPFQIVKKNQLFYVQAFQMVIAPLRLTILNLPR